MFIDGLNLYNGLVSTSWGRTCRWLDPWKLGVRVCNQLKSDGTDWRLTHVHYFTSIVLNAEKARKQMTFLKAIEATGGDRVTITRGKYKRWPIKCRVCDNPARCHTCGEDHYRVQEKGTDVAMSVAMISMCCGHESNNIILVSGDSDLGPAVKAARGHFEKKVLIACPPERNSALQGDHKFVLKKGHFRGVNLPREIEVEGTSPEGEEWAERITAPDGWLPRTSN